MTKTAIVTGAASGIGLALSSALVRRGWRVTLADIAGRAAAAEAERLSRAGPGRALAATLDVRDAQAVADLVHRTFDRDGSLDLMVNNAGVTVNGEPEELPLEYWERAVDVDLRGVINGCHAAYPLMKQQGHGQILNVASTAGLWPTFGQQAPYAAAKWGVVGLSLALRTSGADFGIRVSVLCPGPTDTPINDRPVPADLPIPPSLDGVPFGAELWARAGVTPCPPDRLAEQALRGLERNKAILVIPSSERRYWWLWRYAPALSLRGSQWVTRMARKENEKARSSHVQEA